MQPLAAYSPAFLDIDPSTASDALASSAPPSQAIAASDQDPSYRPERHGSFAEFLRHADYAALKKRVNGHIDTLTALAPERSDIRRQLETFRQRFFDIGLDGRHLTYGDGDAAAPLMFSQGARLLDRIVPLLREGPLPLESRLTELEELASGLTVCVGGAVDALHTCVNRLDAGRASLAGKFRSTVERAVEQVAVEAVERWYKDVFRDAALDQRHYVTGLKPELYQALGLQWPLPEDKFAHRCDRALIAPCVAHLQASLSPAAIAQLLADDYLARVSNAVRENSEWRQPTSARIVDAINACTTGLAAEFGAPPPLNALLHDRNDDGHYEPRTDATLVALHFLDELRNAGVLARPIEPRTLATWTTRPDRDLPSLRCELRTIDGLTWVEENGHRRLAEPAELRKAPADAIRPPAVQAEHSVPDSAQDIDAVHRGEAALIRALIRERAANTRTDAELHSELARLLVRTYKDRPQRMRSADGRLIMPALTDRHPDRLSWPLTQWLDTVGAAIRATPQQVTGKDLVEVLLTAQGDAPCPFIQCLTHGNKEMRELVLVALMLLERDGHVDVNDLIERACQAQTAPQDWPARLASFGPGNAQALLEFAARSTADRHLTPDRCRALFAAPCPETRSASAVPLTWLQTPGFLEHDKSLPLMASYFSALETALSRGVIARDELPALLGLGQDPHPIAALWSQTAGSGASGGPWPRALSKWFIHIARLCERDLLTPDQALALMMPATSSGRPRWEQLETPWQRTMAGHVLASMIPTLELGAAGAPSPKEYIQRRQQLLEAAVGGVMTRDDGRRTCRLLECLPPAERGPLERKFQTAVALLYGTDGHDGSLREA
ncbi:hypothetical protein [Roseateles sp. MS654]|uniref:hypothetical protein n=1 Tax=Roseateles sp. MS654 TaxID=3412685 RepID=UPI003C2D87AD